MKMTWLDLYNILNEKANDIANLNSQIWNQPIIAHNAETGDEHICYTLNITDNNNARFVLVYNDSEWENVK